jgi:hypothetical protein
MIEGADIWRAAEQMRKLYGADAAIYAAMRADKLMDQGDTESFEMWKRPLLRSMNWIELRRGMVQLLRGTAPPGDRCLYDFYR